MAGHSEKPRHFCPSRLTRFGRADIRLGWEHFFAGSMAPSRPSVFVRAVTPVGQLSEMFSKLLFVHSNQRNERQASAQISPLQDTCFSVKTVGVIIRAFVKLREVPATHTNLARKLEQLEATQKEHAVALIAVVNEIK